MSREDVFKDIARIPKEDRNGIREGSVCTVLVNGQAKQLIVRGAVEQLNGGIMLDDITREVLGKLQVGMSYDFTIEEVGIWGHVKWACTVADRGPRIAAWIGVVSLVLGLVGLLLGIIGIFISLR